MAKINIVPKPQELPDLSNNKHIKQGQIGAPKNQAPPPPPPKNKK